MFILMRETDHNQTQVEVKCHGNNGDLCVFERLTDKEKVVDFSVGNQPLFAVVTD